MDGTDWIWRGLANAVLVATALRLLASIVSGLVEIGAHQDEFVGRVRAADILTTMGGAGDAESALLGLAAFAAIVVVARSTPDDTWLVRRLSGLRLLMIATAALAVAAAVGDTLFAASSLGEAATTSRWIFYLAIALAALILALSIAIAARRFSDAVVFDRDGDWVVFAIDKHSRDVRAFLSQSEALRRLPWASLEEDEYELVRDDGRMLSVDFGPPTRLVETEQLRPAELAEALHEYAVRNELTPVGDGTPEPLDYALPMHARQWLDMWPHWLRPIGMLIRKVQGP